MIKSYKDLLRNLDEDEFALLPSSYDTIGDIVIIKIPEQLLSRRYEIGKALYEFLPRSKSILRVSEPTSGAERTREYEILYGSNSTETIHKESGCLIKVDPRKVFFSPRLSYERIRIAKLVHANEIIINMFAGAGPYSILIAKNCPSATVYSIELNPWAHHYMVENVKLNKVEGKVIPILGDAREITGNFIGTADRILMPLPESAYLFLDIAIKALKPEGGFIHYYDNSYEKGLERIREIIGEKAEIESKRVVKSVGPRRYHVVIDIRVCS